MTTASAARRQRRLEIRAAQNAAKAQSAPQPAPQPDPTVEAPKSVITLTEVPGTKGGFTIGLGLHGARMDELHPGKDHPLSIVDVIALAVVQTIRAQPQSFQDAVSLVSETLKGVNQAIGEGTPVAEAVAVADEALSGALSDAVQEAPANVD